ncbi:MAG: protein kinase [Candidatus Omnitrophica bacterium]|nr:protein kinase [Candidatus Omnitrophota bacterium]
MRLLHEINRKALKAVAAATALAYFFCFVAVEARAAVDMINISFHNEEGIIVPPYAHFDIDTFSVPSHMGEIKHKFHSDNGKVIIHIQDAHCNRFAQQKVSDILSYLNEEYGFSLINLEGGEGPYDLSTFTSISGEAIRQEVAEYFLEKGEINGAEFFAINNPDSVQLWGIENSELYLENLNVYRESLEYKKEALDMIRRLFGLYGKLKRRSYSRELFRVDDMYRRYKEREIDLKKYLAFVYEKAALLDVDTGPYRNTGLLVKAMDREDRIDFERANSQRDELIELLKRRLSRNEIRGLVAKTVDFKTKRISRKDFYRYLLARGTEAGLDMSGFAQLSDYVEYVSIFEGADKFLVMSEVEELTDKIKYTLCENAGQRRLVDISKILILTESIFELTLTRNDYSFYTANRESFSTDNHISFLRDNAALYDIEPREYEIFRKLDGYMERIEKFFVYSFARDDAFLNNLRFQKIPDGTRVAVLMTGGFHTANLCEKFRHNGISYISIMPRFTNEKGYKSPYFHLLAGEPTGLEQMIRPILVRASLMQVASKLNEKLGWKVWGEAIDLFRVSVRLVENAVALSKKGPGVTCVLVLNGEEIFRCGDGEVLEIDAAEEIRAMGYTVQERAAEEPAETAAGPEDTPFATTSWMKSLIRRVEEATGGAIPVVLKEGVIASVFEELVYTGLPLLFSALLAYSIHGTVSWYYMVNSFGIFRTFFALKFLLDHKTPGTWTERIKDNREILPAAAVVALNSLSSVVFFGHPQIFLPASILAHSLVNLTVMALLHGRDPDGPGLLETVSTRVAAVPAAYLLTGSGEASSVVEETVDMPLPERREDIREAADTERRSGGPLTEQTVSGDVIDNIVAVLRKRLDIPADKQDAIVNARTIAAVLSGESVKENYRPLVEILWKKIQGGDPVQTVRMDQTRTAYEDDEKLKSWAIVPGKIRGPLTGEEYDIETSALGTGGFAGVFRDPATSRAVKILKPKPLNRFGQPDEESAVLAQMGLIREYLIMMGLGSNDETVGVVEAGSIKYTGNSGNELMGSAYIVEELMEDGTLREELDNRQGGLSRDEALNVAEKLIRAVTNLHGRGVLHLDIKDANIFIEKGPDGRIDNIKLGDFGLAVYAPDGELSMDNLRGTLAHMPSSTISTYSYNRKGDLFAAGIVIYNTLKGSLPYEVPKSMEEVNSTWINARKNAIKEAYEKAEDPLERFALRLMMESGDDALRSDEEALEQLAAVKAGYTAEEEVSETPQSLAEAVSDIEGIVESGEDFAIINLMESDSFVDPVTRVMSRSGKDAVISDSNLSQKKEISEEQAKKFMEIDGRKVFTFDHHFQGEEYRDTTATLEVFKYLEEAERQGDLEEKLSELENAVYITTHKDADSLMAYFIIKNYRSGIAEGARRIMKGLSLYSDSEDFTMPDGFTVQEQEAIKIMADLLYSVMVINDLSFGSVAGEFLETVNAVSLSVDTEGNVEGLGDRLPEEIKNIFFEHKRGIERDTLLLPVIFSVSLGDPAEMVEVAARNAVDELSERRYFREALGKDEVDSYLGLRGVASYSASPDILRASVGEKYDIRTDGNGVIMISSLEEMNNKVLVEYVNERLLRRKKFSGSWALVNIHAADNGNRVRLRYVGEEGDLFTAYEELNRAESSKREGYEPWGGRAGAGAALPLYSGPSFLSAGEIFDTLSAAAPHSDAEWLFAEDFVFNETVESWERDESVAGAWKGRFADRAAETQGEVSEIMRLGMRFYIPDRILSGGVTYETERSVDGPVILGSGRDGVVVRAKAVYDDGRPEKTVAVKIQSPDSYPYRKARFMREAALLKKLSEDRFEGIAGYEGAGFFEQGEGASKTESPFIALEYFKDGSLMELVRNRGAEGINEEEAIYIAGSALRALHELHSSGVVHGDIKPENILLDINELRDGRIRSMRRSALGDLGTFAYDPEAAAGGELRIKTSYFQGTPAFALPAMMGREASGAEYSRRSDLYALGCVMGELLLGKSLYSIVRAEDADASGEIEEQVEYANARQEFAEDPVLLFMARLVAGPDHTVHGTRGFSSAAEAMAELPSIRDSLLEKELLGESEYYLLSDDIEGILRGIPSPEEPAETDMADAGYLGNIGAGLDDEKRDGNGKTELERWKEESLADGRDASRETIGETGRSVESLVRERFGRLLDEKWDDIEKLLEESGADSVLVRRVIETGAGRREGSPGGEDRLGWMRAKVDIEDGDEKYLLGTESSLAIDLIEFLALRETETGTSDLLDEYILHETLEKTDLKHREIITMTSNIFSRGQYEAPGETPLGRELRRYIDQKVGVIQAERAKEAIVDMYGARARAAAEDIRKDQIDIIAMPGSEEYEAQLYAANREATRKLHRDYGQETIPFSYAYDGSDGWKDSMLSLMKERMVPELRQKQKEGARMLLYLPIRSGEVDGLFSEGGLFEEFADIRGLVTVIPQADSIPENGVIDNVMHIVLAKALLNKERFRKDWQRAEMSDESNRTILRLLEAMMEPGAMRELIDKYGYSEDLINSILDGNAELRIRRIDFQDIVEWKKTQDAILRSL